MNFFVIRFQSIQVFTEYQMFNLPLITFFNHHTLVFVAMVYFVSKQKKMKMKETQSPRAISLLTRNPLIKLNDNNYQHCWAKAVMATLKISSTKMP